MIVWISDRFNGNIFRILSALLTILIVIKKNDGVVEYSIINNLGDHFV